MQAGNLVTSDVQAFTSRVTVSGIQRSTASWSVSRELSGDLPEQVTAVAGITQATGSIVWTEGDDVGTQARNPWNTSVGWLPSKGDRVQIFAGDGVTEWVQFTGIIDNTTGSVGGGYQSVIIDDYDKFSSKFSHPPLLRIMPPLEEGQPLRGVGLTSTYYINAMMRQAGFYSTPPTEPGPALSVPCQGSMWPDQGFLGVMKSGGGYDPGWDHARNFSAPWGWAVGNFKNTYSPRVRNSLSTPVQITTMVAPNHSANFTIDIYYGTTLVRLAVWDTRSAAAYVDGVNVVGFSAAEIATATIITVLIKGTTVTLKANNGATATGTRPAVGTTIMGDIVIGAPDGCRVAGIQVSHPTTVAQEFASMSFVPSAVLDMGGLGVFSSLIDAGPQFESRSSTELLKEISQATLAGMWIDELGRARWTPSVVLAGKVPDKTVTTLDDVLALGWEDSLLGARSKVTVTARIPAISRSIYCKQTVYTGSGDDLESGEKREEFVGPESDQDWVMPDESLTMLGELSWSLYNSGHGTFGGVYYTNGGNPADGTGLTASVSMEKLGLTRYKITHQAGTYPTGTVATLATSETNASLWSRNKGKPLPVIRAFGKVDWTDLEISPVNAGNVGPELTHDAGPWNSLVGGNNVELIAIADYLAAQTTNPKPTITGLQVVFDPRLQLGDVITISSTTLMGVTMKGLVVGVDNSAGPSFSQSLAVRILSSTSAFTSYAEYQKSLPESSLTYTQWQALGPTPSTYSTLNAG